jgi:hypothetical protein
VPSSISAFHTVAGPEGSRNTHPKSAIDAGACDIVAKAAELPQRILWVAAKHPIAAPSFAGTGEDSEQALNAILGLLRAASVI